MPSSVAFLFPGQGRVPDALPTDRRELASLIGLIRESGLPLDEWIERGDHDRLAKTDAAQPALFLDSLGRERGLRDAGWEPTCVAGHSLGEYAAWVSAGVLDATAALRAVLERGRLMLSVSGAMAAVLKLTLSDVERLCAGTEAVVANHNAEQQIVVSGPEKDVQEVTAAAEGRGGRCIRLNVSGPFHSPLMRPAEQALAPLLGRLSFHPPVCDVVSGVSGRAEADPEQLRALLLHQMTSPVRWVDVTQELVRLGIETAVEVGSGDVLTRLGTRSGAPIRFLTYEEALHERL